MTQTLEMVFRNAGGKEVVLSLADPKDDIALASVKPVMEDIITKSVFETKGGALTQIVEARLATKESTVLS